MSCGFGLKISRLFTYAIVGFKSRICIYITKFGDAFAIHTYNFEILKSEAIISANIKHSIVILVCGI
jgi:hypothetical protein